MLLVIAKNGWRPNVLRLCSRFWNIQYCKSLNANISTFSKSAVFVFQNSHLQLQCISSTKRIELYVRFSTNDGILNPVKYEKISAETLESLTDYFEEIIENEPSLKSADVTYGDGVLTVSLGKPHGTYVINKQTPNLQIWLSSPSSGPKRYDFIDGTWVYKHDNTTLHSLLDKEITEIVKSKVEFSKRCLFAKEKISS